MKLSFNIILIFSIVLLLIIDEIHPSLSQEGQNAQPAKKTTKKGSTKKISKKLTPGKSKVTTKKKSSKQTTKSMLSTKQELQSSTIPTPEPATLPTISPASRTLYNNIIKEVNQYRKKHGSPPLKQQDQLTFAAEEWVKDFAKSGGDKTQTRFEKLISESVASFPNANNANAKTIAKNFYDQGRNYNYEKPERSLETSSFTAMLWKSSKEIGCATAKDSKGALHILCKYFPVGNIFGKYKENVLKPT
uniref:SCP domain-containing protein n=1 Tax=Parastrongyloides trichosuri TaxID=131310 RepID=A0A0N4ZZE5_PARTI